MATPGDPEVWAKAASASAGQAKGAATTTETQKLAESLEYLGWAVAILAERMPRR